jgi:hypothetical protein
MTEQRRDDRMLDAAVEAAWRQTAQEQPPAGVDAAILAAARAAVQSGASERNPAKPSRWWANWQPLAAAAGVIGISFLLVQMLPREHLARPPAKQGAPQPAAESAPVTVAPAPSAGAAHPARAEERAATAGAAPRAAMEAGAAKQSVAAKPESPAAWASRIASLHDAGDLSAAAAELRAFRASNADADLYLPEPLRAWAASVTQDGTP